MAIIAHCICSHDRPIIQDSHGCQQVLLRLRPYPMRGHRLLCLPWCAHLQYKTEGESTNDGKVLCTRYDILFVEALRLAHTPVRHQPRGAARIQRHEETHPTFAAHTIQSQDHVGVHHSFWFDIDNYCKHCCMQKRIAWYVDKQDFCRQLAGTLMTERPTPFQSMRGLLCV